MLVPAATAMACLAITAMGSAQVVEPVYVPGSGYVVPPTPPYYGGYGWGYNTWGAGSTPAGSYLSGLANAIRAEGEYNLNTSQAAINLEEAQRREIENRRRWTQTYFEMRRINQAYTHPKKEPLPPETWARLAHDAAPERLPSSVLDPLSGTIYWPSALQGEEFRADREALEQLFAERASVGGAIGVEGYAHIRRTVDNALARLKSQIRLIDSTRYLEARNFLTSLGYEANFPASG
jgi:hypothetical protein